MATPFAADGSLDLDASRTLARYLVEHGSEGLVLAGTTGEGPTLTDGEKLALFDAVARRGRLRRARHREHGHVRHGALGAPDARGARRPASHGFLAVTPYYNKPPAEGLARHFAAIATAADGLPVIIYNIPQRVILNLEPDLLVRLAHESANVVAVKQATTDLDQARAILDSRARALRRQRRPARAVPRARRLRAASASPRTSSAARCCACASWPRPATSTACARSIAS